MMQATFVNFVAFGKRTSIDLRIVISIAGYQGIPVNVHVGDECENTGDYDGIHRSFTELAEACFEKLRVELFECGHAGLVELLDSALDDVRLDASEGEGYLSREGKFSSFVAFFYMLNNTEFIYG